MGRETSPAFRDLTGRETGAIFHPSRRSLRRPKETGVPLRLFGAGSTRVRPCPACERKIKADATFCPACYMVFRPEGAADLREFLQGARIPADVYLLRKMQSGDPNAGPVTRVAPPSVTAENSPAPVALPPDVPTEVATPEIEIPSVPPSQPIPEALLQEQPAPAEQKPASPHGGKWPISIEAEERNRRTPHLYDPASTRGPLHRGCAGAFRLATGPGPVDPQPSGSSSGDPHRGLSR